MEDYGRAQDAQGLACCRENRQRVGWLPVGREPERNHCWAARDHHRGDADPEALVPGGAAEAEPALRGSVHDDNCH
eukprot:4172024-Pyramimonas_sp.AAC.1